MKKLLILSLLLSTSAFAAQTIDCTGAWRGSDSSHITATVLSNTSIDFLSDSSPGDQSAKNLRNIQANASYKPHKVNGVVKYANFNQFKYSYSGITPGMCELMLPKNITSIRGKFKAFDICHSSDGGGTMALDCTSR